MNTASVEKIANAVLYEGYLLYPYRPNSTKNRQRWNFGTLYPKAYSAAHAGAEPCSFHAELLMAGSQNADVELRTRFLQFARTERAAQDAAMQPDTAPWDEAVERNVFVAPIANSELQRTPAQVPFATPAEQIEEGGTLRVVQDIHGLITLGAAPVAPDVWRISLQVTNTTESQSDAREDVLRQSLVSAHAIVQVTNGELISLLEPPPHLAEAAAACRNHGVFPVLAGERLRPDTMLISPIILYDYPETAAESSGDFFDATEIDEMLTLRVLTLSNEEKEQMRNGDQRAREILERTSGIGEEQLLKIHGAVRGLRRAERKS